MRERERESHRERDRQTDRETDRQTDRQKAEGRCKTDRQTDRQTDSRQTDRQTDRQADRQTETQRQRQRQADRQTESPFSVSTSYSHQTRQAALKDDKTPPHPFPHVTPPSQMLSTCSMTAETFHPLSVMAAPPLSPATRDRRKVKGHRGQWSFDFREPLIRSRSRIGLGS